MLDYIHHPCTGIVRRKNPRSSLLVHPKVMSSNVYQYQTVFPFESSIAYHDLRIWLRRNQHIPFIIIAIYLVMVFGIKKWMRDRKPFKLTGVLVVWNLSLSMFSMIGSLRTIPQILHTVRSHGIHYSLCCEGDVSGVYGFWTSLFILSKIPELGDTMFVVLRKQKLIFLHWFHHLTVLILVWFCNIDSFSLGRYFMVMNYIVHSVMYSYYALKSVGFRLARSLSMFITTLQLAQMFIGLYITSYVYVEKFEERPCEMAQFGLYISLIMYLSYLLLFLNFFLRSYLGSVLSQKDAISKMEPIIRGIFGKPIQPSAIILSGAHSNTDHELPFPSFPPSSSSSLDDFCNNNDLRFRRIR